MRTEADFPAFRVVPDHVGRRRIVDFGQIPGLVVLIKGIHQRGYDGCGQKNAENIDEHKGRYIFDKYAFEHGASFDIPGYGGFP